MDISSVRHSKREQISRLSLGGSSSSERVVCVRRRRRWSASEKSQIVAESFFPGANISEVARRHGVGANVLFRWRREAMDTSSPEPAAFVPVTLAAAVISPCEAKGVCSEAPYDAAPGLIEIELADARIRLRGRVSEAQLRMAVAVVRGLA